MGSVLWPQPAPAHAQITTTVQFDREIVHILDNHCVMCHVEKGLTFPLVTYEQTYALRWKIRQDALDRHMPPWAAMPGDGDFANDNGLTQREIDFLVSWAESFGPRNNGEIYTGVAAMPSARKIVRAHIDFDRWALGRPDLRLQLPENAANPRNPDETTRTLIDPRLASDRWLRGLEYKPGDRRIVRAVSFAIQETGQWIGSWTPWHGFVSLPKGLAYRLPAGSHILADIRYRGSNEPATGQGTLGLYFAGQSSQRAVSTLVLEAKPALSSSAAAHKWVATTRLAADTTILALQPELRPGVQSIEVAVRAPGGATQVLLFAKDIPMQWPTPYVFTTPVSLRKGTDLTVIEHYASDDAAAVAAIPVTFSAYQGAPLTTGRRQVQRLAPPTQHFKLAGTVKSVDAANGRLVVQHDDIPGFMQAMTMSYEVRKPEELQAVRAGDTIQSDVVVSDTGSYLENIRVLGQKK